MPKIDILRDQLQAVEAEIKNLSGFRDTPFVRKFRRQLQGEKSVILQKIQSLSLAKADETQLRSQRLAIANKNRSEKMKRNWRYLEAIKRNYPVDLSKKELRTALKKHRQGLETDVPDVAWRNPSP